MAEENEKLVDQEEVQKETACDAETTDQTVEAEVQDAEKEPTAEEKIEKLEKENAELKDQVLRRAAEFDNYRKRMLKEKQDTYDYANASLLGDLLDSLDNFDRTLDAANNATDVKTIVEGIKMINGNLIKMLEDKYNLSSYGKSGDAFNPDEHEAIGRVQNPEIKEPVLKEVYLKGYKLKDKVIRHAKVMVEMPAE